MPEPATCADTLVHMLEALGVEHVLGVSGGAVVPLHDAFARSERVRLWHTRSESGAAFAATEASLSSDRPVAVFATTGPGLTNALTGIAAARCEGARVVLVSGMTSAPLRGRWACQETSSWTMPSDLFAPGAFFDLATVVEHPAQLAMLRARLHAGFTRPQGFVAHLALPLAIQTSKAALAPDVRKLTLAQTPSASELVPLVAALRSGPIVIWVGYGARHAAEHVRMLAEVLDARVMCTPRAKGIFPEHHPRFLGVTGLGGHEAVNASLRELRPRHTLVLGTRLGELSSFWREDLQPEVSFIQIDVERESFGIAYPEAATWGVCAELRATLSALLELLGPVRIPASVRAEATQRPPGPGRIRPSWLFEAIQREIVDRSDALVMTEAGNALAWGNHTLRFDAPGRYRVSSQFGAMGHFACGAIGPALTGRRTVAVIGDGSMLMTNELSTAVQYELPATWIVLNDGQYGMIEHGMQAQGFQPAQLGLPDTDFAAYARSLGAHGIRVEHEHELDQALRAGLDTRGPVVIDVVIDPHEPSPFLSRTQSLVRQGGGGAPACVPGGAA